MTLKLIHNKISMFKLILFLFIFSVIIYSPISNDKAFAAITLNWTAPTTNTDGSTLTDLAGYKIYYGNSSGNYTNSVNVGNASSYTFSSLNNGTYYFAATAYDTSGVESALSNEVAKTQSAVSDTTPPTVTSFTIPSSSSSLTISIASFSASDTVGVVGYMITESSTKPSSSANGWLSTAPTSYTVAASGAHTLYGYAKDAAGNVSSGKSATVTVTQSTVSTAVSTQIAVFRPSGGRWYILNSSNNTSSSRQWGANGDIPVPGDYDGIGKPEMAVFRPSNGVWYILNSSNNTSRSVQWGANRDIPVPGY